MKDPIQAGRLVVVWADAGKAAALEMLFQYLRDCLTHHWWQEVELVLWGPSVELMEQDGDIAAELQVLKNLGCRLTACVACLRRYRAGEAARRLGVQPKPMSQALTGYLQSQDRVLLL